MKRMLNSFLSLIFIFAFLTIFQNCGGTTVINPLRFSKAQIRFEPFAKASLQNVRMCLTNVVLRFSPESDLNVGPVTTPVLLPTSPLESGFDLSYFYSVADDADPENHRYFINGVFKDHPIEINPDGTMLAELNLPETVYDRVVFGFSDCTSGQRSLSFENESGSFSDAARKFIGFSYTGDRDLHTSAGSEFAIQFFTSQLDSVTSNLDLQTTLNPYRSFDLIGLSSTTIPNYTQIGLNDLAATPDNKTIAVAFARPNGGAGRLVVARYDENGALDATFGDASFLPGMASYLTGTGDEGGRGVAVSLDGSIYIATKKWRNAQPDLAVIKLDSNGQIVSQFGENGWFYVNSGMGQDFAHELAILPDGNLLLLGSTDQRKIILAKFNPNGQLVTSFGDSGIAAFDYVSINPTDEMALSLQADGRVLVGATQGRNGASDFLVLRVDALGTSAERFTVQPTSGRLKLKDMLVQPDGKIVLVGFATATRTYVNKNFAVARLNADGSLDTSFGDNGRVIKDMGGEDTAQGCLLNDKGQLVISGEAVTDMNMNYALLVLDSSGRPDTTVSPLGVRLFYLNKGTAGGHIVTRSNGSLSMGGSDTTSVHLLTLAK